MIYIYSKDSKVKNDMKLRSKSQTLKNLELRNAKVPKLKIFKCSSFIKNQNEVVNKIKSSFGKKKIAIRSSFNNEDTKTSSNAGRYKSFLNVDPNKDFEIKSKIDELIKSKKNVKKNEEFFVQEMVTNLSFSGVILTRNLEDYSPCININYFDGKDTEAVTSGKTGSKSIIYYENKKFKLPKKFIKLYLLINEIRKKYNEKDLDVEFAVDKKNVCFVLQIRKLIVPKSRNQKLYRPKNYLNKLEKKISKLKKKHHDLLGDTTYFGVMPDWNPAEILGIKPRPLALSLYRELITDHIWSKNRKEYGFRELSQFHLMTTFYGTPFIDIRIDFNSWIPQNLSKNIAQKITNYYLKKFNLDISLHDKIEFRLLFTCITFNTKKKLKEDLKKILNENEIKTFYNELKKININAISKKEIDIKNIKELSKKQSIIEKSNLYEIDKIYWLIEDCKKYGTISFAGLARCGFIAIDLLNSLEEIGVIKNNDKIEFLSNISTITTDLKKDLKKFSKKKFLKKYGHLRPGTYDITSDNYSDGYNKYFSNKKNLNDKKTKVKNSHLINISKKQLNKIGIYNTKKQLLDFIIQSIQYREYSKFVFTKSIDLIFKNLIKFGKKYKINKDDLSFIKIDKITEMYFNLTNYQTIPDLKQHILENKKEYFQNKNIALPDVIRTGRDLYVQYKNFDKINYISNKQIISKVLKYDHNNIKKSYNGIVCIENADPGYDFLFNKGIKGLITKYGGLNSHMAIRCSELNLPALIGVGEKNFNNMLNHKFINIDCVKKKIDFIN